jgi:RNA recognition motif-containing protein
MDKINIITDRATGRSRGFGFVEMPDSRAAQSAIQGLQGQELNGRTLTVNEAKPREPRREFSRPRW